MKICFLLLLIFIFLSGFWVKYLHSNEVKQIYTKSCGSERAEYLNFVCLMTNPLGMHGRDMKLKIKSVWKFIEFCKRLIEITYFDKLALASQHSYRIEIN
jgi:hypothetical protein